MKKFLRKLADEKAVLFWCLSLLVFMVIGYKSFSTVFLEKTGYTWDTSFLKLSLLLMVIIMMKEIYSGQFYFNFRGKNFFKALMLAWPCLLFIGLNLSDVDFSKPVVLEGFVMLLVETAIIGLYEEVLCRGLLVGHMMYHWKNDPKMIKKSVLCSSVIFGVLHIGNLFSGAGLIVTLIQVVYATVLGILFAAIYVRTRNIWAVALVHCLVDFSAFIITMFTVPQPNPVEPEAGAGSSLAFLLILLGSVIFIAWFAMFLIRKKKHDEIVKLWQETPLMQPSIAE